MHALHGSGEGSSGMAFGFNSIFLLPGALVAKTGDRGGSTELSESPPLSSFFSKLYLSFLCAASVALFSVALEKLRPRRPITVGTGGLSEFVELTQAVFQQP